MISMEKLVCVLNQIKCFTAVGVGYKIKAGQSFNFVCYFTNRLNEHEFF